MCVFATRKRCLTVLVLAFAFSFLVLQIAGAQQEEKKAKQRPGTAVHFFAYYTKKGMRSLFEEGYRRHLEWHHQKNDPLLWYAWFVSCGERSGLFIDGCFGSPFSAFDKRVDPVGDGIDFRQMVTPFVDPAFQCSYVLRPELSTGQPLEELQPSPNIQVFHYVLHAGMESRFEEVLTKLRAALLRSKNAPVHTWYQLIVGGEHPGYMLMIPRYRWADYDVAKETITTMIENAYEPKEARRLLGILAQAVKHVHVETWSYREDLTYFPKR